MKKGINQFSLPDAFSLKSFLMIAKKAGFEGVEISLGEKAVKEDFQNGNRIDKELGISDYRNDDFTLDTPREKIQAIKKMADKIGIRITSLVSLLLFRYPLTSHDQRIRDRSISIVSTALEYASWVGADTVLVIPGQVTEEVAYDQAYDQSLSALKDLARVAERFQVNIGIENVWNKFLLSPLEFRDFIDKIGSSWVGAYLDIGNLLISGYPDQWIRILGKRIKKIHIKDFKGQIGNITGFVQLLAGDLNWPKTIKALEAIEYNDYLVAEIMPPFRYYPEELFFETSSAMDVILGRNRANKP